MLKLRNFINKISFIEFILLEMGTYYKEIIVLK